MKSIFRKTLLVLLSISLVLPMGCGVYASLPSEYLGQTKSLGDFEFNLVKGHWQGSSLSLDLVIKNLDPQKRDTFSARFRLMDRTEKTYYSKKYSPIEIWPRKKKILTLKFSKIDDQCEDLKLWVRSTSSSGWTELFSIGDYHEKD